MAVAELALWRDRAAENLRGWRLDGEPLPLGGPWPGGGRIWRLEHDLVHVPTAWPLRATRLELMLAGEGVMRLAYPDGSSEAFGIDVWHVRFPLRQRAFSLSADLVARQPYGRPQLEPRLDQARLVWIDEDVETLYRRLSLLAEAASALAGESLGSQLLIVGEKALAGIELGSESASYLARAAGQGPLRSIWTPIKAAEPLSPLSDPARASVVAAAEQLAADLQGLTRLHPAPGRFAITGHAHLDLAWLWPIEEGVRKAQRTFSTICGLLERWPEATFVQSSAELYQLVRESDPVLYARLRKLAAEGQWEATGGMWAECDQNMPSGESLVRQLLYGQRFFERELGARHRVCWLPDCFGFNPALPQLLRGAGIDSIFTTKLNWSETNRFPYDLWWWEGLDGSRVLAHAFENRVQGRESLGDYNGEPRPGSLLATWRAFRGQEAHSACLFTVGYGDGGGGMTEGMIEDVRELASYPGLPELAFTRVEDFFQDLHRTAEKLALPVWVDEMYLELHRGTLTTQGRTKRLHRRAERDLVAAETLWAVCSLLGKQGPTHDLTDAWRLLLRNQFHDILPGTSIGEVHRRAESELAEVIVRAHAAIDSSLERLREAEAGEPSLLVVNPDLSARPLRVELTEPFPGAQAVEQGWVATDPTSSIHGLEVAILPALAAPASGRAAQAWEKGLNNGLLRVEVGGDGTLASVYDLQAGREALAGPGNQIWAYSDRPRAWDAWDIDADYARQGEPVGSPASVEVVESGPHRAALRLEWRYRSSRVVQLMRLWAGSARLDFDTWIEWKERRVLLKARFPLAIRSRLATFETAFGVVQRPTHRNTSWDQARFEVTAHRFADLSQPGYGVALLNNGRYGHHALGNELGITLLRSPVYPDPLADAGDHHFTYSLLPHAGNWLEGGVLAEAEDLNRPLLARVSRSGREPQRRQALTVTGPALALAALKPAEEGSGDQIVVRLYEPQGASGTARLALPYPWRVARELNLLEDPAGSPAFDFSPFRVRTYLLERGD
jgi:alpha-mannosidase